MTDLLELALDDLVPAFTDARPDWADVVVRSGRRPSAGRSRRRRVVMLVLALLLIVLLATPAFGVQGYVLQLLGRKNVSFGSSPSAPNVVKKQFLDLPIGAPLRFAPQVEAAQARVVATFAIAGRPRKLWVAPTRRGGYCYAFERSFGGCRATRAERSGPFGATWGGPPPKAHLEESIVTRVGGDLTEQRAQRITARYADGTRVDIPFVWVSRPIAAGFFSYDIPTAHWSRARRLVSLTLYARDGGVLGRQRFPYRAYPTPVRVPPAGSRAVRPRVLPVAPPTAPSAPTHERTADGYRVVVGANGAVQFRQTRETPILHELSGKNVSFACFRLTTEFGIFTVRGFGEWGALAPKVGFSLAGIGTPVDGCEIEASIGRRWPDRLHNRAAVEIPLTARGRRYFVDRAAARDLALFVRSRRMHVLRREPAPRAKADILRTYGELLARSPIRIRVAGRRTLVVTERSPSGRLFSVTLRDGRIAKQNLEPLAFVF
jgi:hypothetical protein